MQLSIIYVALATAMTAFASTVFSVANFEASCAPNDKQCSYSFVLFSRGSGETASTGVQCSKKVDSDGTLPALSGGTCARSSRTWTVSKPSTGGLVITASQQVTPSSYKNGKHTITDAELATQTTGTSIHQSYIGPKDFDLEFV